MIRLVGALEGADTGRKQTFSLQWIIKEVRDE